MTFAAPVLLAGLLLVPLALAVYLAVQRRRSRYVVRFTNVDLLANIAPRRPGVRRHVPAALYLAAMTFLVVALARPSMTLEVPREEATVMLTMDVSRSMEATDVDPTRLTAAKEAAATFVDSLPEQFRVGLIAFSTDARLVVAPTTDRAEVQDAIADLRTQGGTALGDAIALSVDATADARAASSDGDAGGSAATPASPDPTTTPDPVATPAPSGATGPDDPAAAGEDAVPVTATVLLSDGANSTGAREPLDAAEDAAAAGMPVYTIALGTPDGVVEVQDPFGQPQQLQVPPDTETLQQVAEMTGGRSFDAPTAEDLAQVYEALGSRVGFTTEQQEVTQWFAAAALLLMVGGAGLAALWFNRFP
ncbi:MAG TPA: VWA domain-containing protein [Candidatus Limnocylindrales bacterium]|nr:VWA domain-containing protein [Candidatus Limnocylindrales bacterium]